MQNAVFSLIVVLGIGSLGTNAHAIEEPAYTVVRQYPAFEIRQYAPYCVAEVNVPGPASEAGNQGFKILAAYIFGENKGDRKIDMTAPVTQTPVPKQIAMTAPVTQTASETGFIVQFKMPMEFTIDTLPEPLHSRVKLRELTGGRFAVIRYSGSWSESHYTNHLTQLQQALEAEGIPTRGEPIYSRYNAPYVPWFMRRNEIWLHVD